MIEIETTNHEHEHRHGPGGSVWWGIACIALGIILILQMSHLIRLDNWWALFILIPALASLGTGITRFVRNGGHFTHSVSGSISGALFIGTVAVIFLFRLPWAHIWPLFIILAGLSMLMGSFARRDRLG